MTEVTESRGPEIALDEGFYASTRADARGRGGQMRAISKTVDQRSGDHGQRGSQKQGPLPGEFKGRTPEQMGKGGTQCQHAHKPPQGRTGIAGCPTDHQLHAHGIDTGEAQTRDETCRRRQVEVRGNQDKGGVDEGPHNPGDGKEPAGPDAVREAADRDDQGARHKTGLNGHGQDSEFAFTEAHGPRQCGRDAVDAEPEGSAEQLGDDDDREWGAGEQGVEHECQGLWRVTDYMLQRVAGVGGWFTKGTDRTWGAGVVGADRRRDYGPCGPHPFGATFAVRRCSSACREAGFGRTHEGSRPPAKPLPEPTLGGLW